MIWSREGERSLRGGAGREVGLVMFRRGGKSMKRG